MENPRHEQKYYTVKQDRDVEAQTSVASRKGGEMDVEIF